MSQKQEQKPEIERKQKKEIKIEDLEPDAKDAERVKGGAGDPEPSRR